MRPLFDSHTHLQLSEFDRDRRAVVERARAAGVAGMVVVGIDGPGSRQAVDLASEFDDLYAAVGYHPHDAKTVDGEALRWLRELAAAPRVVALGETGLDFYRNLSPRETQFRVFRQQLDLALEVGLPVVIHSRNAQQETMAVLSEWLAAAGDRARPDGRPVGVIHCFSGSTAAARRYIEMGFLISVAGNVTYPNAEALREAISAVPLEKLLIETDCPFLTPQVERGRRCEPCHVRETALQVAALKSVSPQEVAETTTRNAHMLYRLPVGSDVGARP